MKKKLLSVVTVTLLILVSMPALAACTEKGNGHTHTYTSAWSYDDEHHWRSATCEHADEKNDFASHTWNEGQCAICYGRKSTQGLEYKLSSDSTQYIVVSIGTATETDIVIAQHYNGKPVTTIIEWAFRDCSSITSVTIPDSVTHIGYEAFSGCSDLTSVSVSDSIISIYDRAFYGCDSLRYNEYDNSWYLGNSKNPYVALIKAKHKYVTSCMINPQTKAICDSAFDGCSDLTNITIGSGVTSIGVELFGDCISLESITVASDNAKYHSGGNCIIETQSKTLIAGCKSSVIPSDGSVTIIGEDAFYKCSGLTNITIPNSINNIKGGAFHDCKSLTHITFQGTKAQWNAIKKEYYWNSRTGEYTVHCADGDIAKE